MGKQIGGIIGLAVGVIIVIAMLAGGCPRSDVGKNYEDATRMKAERLNQEEQGRRQREALEAQVLIKQYQIKYGQ